MNNNLIEANLNLHKVPGQIGLKKSSFQLEYTKKKEMNLTFSLKNKFKFFIKKMKNIITKRKISIMKEVDHSKKTVKQFISFMKTITLLNLSIKKLKWRTSFRSLNYIHNKKISFLNDVSYFNEDEMKIQKFRCKCLKNKNIELVLSKKLIKF